jgi:hypothetical protein
MDNAEDDQERANNAKKLAGQVLRIHVALGKKRVSIPCYEGKGSKVPFSPRKENAFPRILT